MSEGLGLPEGFPEGLDALGQLVVVDNGASRTWLVGEFLGPQLRREGGGLVREGLVRCDGLRVT